MKNSKESKSKVILDCFGLVTKTKIGYEGNETKTARSDETINCRDFGDHQEYSEFLKDLNVLYNTYIHIALHETQHDFLIKYSMQLSQSKAES